MTFTEELKVQRWDDHRYYHHSRVNQSLHLLSAMSFLSAYVLIFFDPVAAAMLGWIVAMCSRQIGHFFFEPKGYDEVNHATHEYKEEIKVGYNLKRKIILLSLWGATPLALYHSPTFYGLFGPDEQGYIYRLSVLWLYLGAGALLFRTVHLFFIKDVRSGLVWLTKILTDPFHDIKIYHKSPVYLLKGELIDPMTHSSS
jgi:hypothetical protein